ncbi:LysR substrate-binding domain-containing protein [Actinomycetes bacterium KLBMP 9797]
MLPSQTPGGVPMPRGPVVSTFHEVLPVVATGLGLSPLNEHSLRYHPHPGIVLLPVHDAPVTEWVMVWRKDGVSPRAQDLVEMATQLGPRAFR